MYVYKSWIKAVFNCSSETHKVLRVLYKEEPSALSLKSDTERHLVFWSEKWWVNSRVYFLENILTITWQFTFKKSSECTSYINHSLVTQIILRFFFFSALSRGGMREEGKRSSWDFKRTWGGLFRIHCFCHFRKKSFPLQKIFFSTLLDNDWSSGGKQSQKANKSLSNHVSTMTGVKKARWGRGVMV